MTPVRTSPLPAVAIPGFPVGFSQVRASSPEPWIRVPAPFSRSTAGKAFVNSATVFNRSRFTSSGVLPISRPISPGWGVSTRGAFRPFTISGSFAARLIPSASRTMGFSIPFNSFRTSSAVSGAFPSPGPTARASYCFISSSIPRKLSSGSFPRISVVASGTAVCSTCTTSQGAATFTSPAPLR